MKYTFLFIAFFISNQLFAQGHNHGNESGLSQQMAGTAHTHSHKKVNPPHGGELIEVGKYDLEVVLNVMEGEEKFNIYILNSKAKVLDVKDASGSITLRYKDGREIITEFKRSDKGKLYCNVEDIINEFVVVININYKGKDYSTVCEYAGLTEHLKNKNQK
jgi:hypothetical protein